MNDEKGLWKVDIATKGVLLRAVVVSDDLKRLAAHYPVFGPCEGLIFEYVAKEKGFDPSDLRSISIEPIPLITQEMGP